MAEIQYLARTYFHPDYDLEAASPLLVVEKYWESEDSATVSALRNEISSALSTRDDDGLIELWLAVAGAQYDPRWDGLSGRAWFERILDVLNGK
ncbi:contact-dependent growth inhibition system immunity protein [Myceligenerans xiligouense]|uniref:CdiI immunity protein domain-containing protein n=1 Tax=Myceligenerans xiligouense TaxID=253184 RepID=A0A3N4YRI9_9MICO|nr:contact-dependent growth inhibition system immunity protein [Myceligenerans xiligouense]RPF21150.1 hypothetical protein EDD34_1769 [Myceligenerans xiligouense]